MLRTIGDLRPVYTIQVSLIKVCDSVNLFQRRKTGLHYPSFFDQSQGQSIKHKICNLNSVKYVI